ncbi:MAG: CoA-binding protein [Pseudomonadota bacterium]
MASTNLRELLETIKTIAVVGASANEERPSFRVGQFLAENGYDVFAINPGLAGQELFGNEVYASLADLPFPVDMVDIFRNSEAAGNVVDEALQLEELPKAIWMQLGVINKAAAEKAETAGIIVVMDRCPKIELSKT